MHGFRRVRRIHGQPPRRRRCPALFAAALSLFASAVAIDRPAQGSAPPIKIGAIYILSGPFGIYGEYARNGLELAVDRINADGGVLGRPLQVVLADSEGKANVAIGAIRRLLREDAIDVLMGLDSSGVARSVVPIMRRFETPLIVTHAATPDITGPSCNTWVYRNGVNIAQNMRAASTIAAGTSAKRWTTIGPNYTFGHQSWSFFRDYLKQEQPDASFLEPQFPGFNAGDFRPAIHAAMAQDPEGVLVSLWGGDLIKFVRQARELDFFEQGFEVMLTLGAAVEVLRELGPEMPEGIWVGTRYWFEGPRSPVNDAFVAAYRDRYGAPPSYNSHNAYAAVYAYKAAIEAAGEVSPEAISAALSDLRVDAPIGTFTFRATDHQATVDAFWGRTGAMRPEGIRGLDPMKVIPGAEVIRDPAETGCSLPSG